MHFILRHKNPVTGEWQEKHAKGVPPVKIDRKSNLYTLIVRPDNSFEILVNNVREKKGRYVGLAECMRRDSCSLLTRTQSSARTCRGPDHDVAVRCQPAGGYGPAGEPPGVHRRPVGQEAGGLGE